MRNRVTAISSWQGTWPLAARHALPRRIGEFDQRRVLELILDRAPVADEHQPALLPQQLLRRPPYADDRIAERDAASQDHAKHALCVAFPMLTTNFGWRQHS
jgi:hypothetical protein